MTGDYDFQYERGDVLEHESENKRVYVQQTNYDHNRPQYVLSTISVGENKHFPILAETLERFWTKETELHHLEVYLSDELLHSSSIVGLVDERELEDEIDCVVMAHIFDPPVENDHIKELQNEVYEYIKANSQSSLKQIYENTCVTHEGELIQIMDRLHNKEGAIYNPSGTEWRST